MDLEGGVVLYPQPNRNTSLQYMQAALSLCHTFPCYCVFDIIIPPLLYLHCCPFVVVTMHFVIVALILIVTWHIADCVTNARIRAPF